MLSQLKLPPSPLSRGLKGFASDSVESRPSLPQSQAPTGKDIKVSDERRRGEDRRATPIQEAVKPIEGKRLEFTGTPLTGPGGEFHVNDALRSLLCFMDDGTLLISKSAIFNPHVQGFVARLRHIDRPYTAHHVDLGDIERAYASARGAKHRASSSQMQITAKDLFTRAVEREASDIHLRVSRHDRTQIWYRVNGDLDMVEEHPEEMGEQLCTAIYQSLADVSDATFEKLSRQDARISARAKIPNGLDGIRIATSPQVDGFLMVLRLLYDSTGESNDLAELGYSDEQKAIIDRLKRRPTGINVMSGPTGCGKSTTLKHVLSAIIQECGGRKHVITVEDPPEYTIVGAVQTPVTNAATEAERSAAFQQSIKAAMRLDPDVMMIGEARDNPSASLALQAAMTGHQVWTTVHANGAFGIISRLIDMGLALNLVTDPSIVTGLACQRLIKKLCPHCKQPLRKSVNRYHRTELERIMQVVSIDTTYVKGPGCDHCRQTGNKGRTVAAEVIETDEELMQLLRNNDRLGAHAYWKSTGGGITIREHAIQKIAEGIADPFQTEDIVGALNYGVTGA
jgi:general secretion pathway protein E